MPWDCDLKEMGVCPGKVYLMHSLDKEAQTELQEQELDVPNSSPRVRAPVDRCGEAEHRHTQGLSWIRPSLLTARTLRTPEVMP